MPPFVGVAVKVTACPEQMLDALALTVTAGVTAGDTTIVMLFEPILAGVAQAAFDVNTQLTTSPFTNDVDEKVGVLLPLFVPFTFHWYDGDVPPFTGVAVKLTVAPAQIVVADAVIDTLGVTAAFTVIVMVFDVSFVFDAQATLLVNTQENTSLLLIVDVDKVALFVPTTVAFLNH